MLKDLTALLLTDAYNIYYLTGFIGAAPQEREAYALITHENTYLFTSSLYTEHAKLLENKNQKLQVLEISREMPLSQRLISILGTHEKQIKLGFEENNIYFSEYKNLKNKLPTIELIPTQNRIEQLRTIKRADEIEKLKKACLVTDEAFEYILKKLKPEITETDIAWELETFFRKNGATSSFPPIVAFNQNASMPHYFPSSDQKLRPNSLILLDFGAKFEGYHADMTRVVFWGKPSQEIENAYTTLLRAQETAIKLLESGQRSGAILDTQTRQELETNSFPEYPHSLGHGVGLAIHEFPRLSMRVDETLKPGMVFSIEPGIYIPGKFGMRIEDLVYINKQNKIEVLSKSQKALTIL